MYPRIPWELVADPLRPAERPLGTTALGGSGRYGGTYYFKLQGRSLRQYIYIFIYLFIFRNVGPLPN